MKKTTTPHPLKNMFLCFFVRKEGLGLIEFAFALPVLLLLFGGVIELTRFVLANQKVDKSAASIADFLGQQSNPQGFDITTLDAAFDKLIQPFDSATSGYIVTGVSLDGEGNNRIVWRQSRGAAGTSKVGPAVGSPANINNVELQVGEEAIVAEVFYKHATILDNIGFISEALNFDNEEIYKEAINLRRVPANPLDGSPQPIPRLYGCCGEYCEEGDITNPNDTDFLPYCACLDIQQLCEYTPNHPAYNTTEAQRRRAYHTLYGCEFNGQCPLPDPAAIPFCDRPENANTCRCNSDLCADGGV